MSWPFEAESVSLQLFRYDELPPTEVVEELCSQAGLALPR